MFSGVHESHRAESAKKVIQHPSNAASSLHSLCFSSASLSSVGKFMECFYNIAMLLTSLIRVVTKRCYSVLSFKVRII